MEIQNNQELLSLKQELKDVFLSVYEEEWLQIEVIKEEDGWEVVKLSEK